MSGNAYREFRRDVFIFATMMLIIGLISNATREQDSCDGPSGRCEMRIRTDKLTGCQYLESTDGALIERMDAQGRQVCGGSQ